MPGTQAHRLPTTVVPSRYGLTIEPDLDAATFTGTEAVSVEVTEPVDEIVLHAKDLEVSDVWLEGPGGERLDGTPTLDTEGETLTIGLSATATVGPWIYPRLVKKGIDPRTDGIFIVRYLIDEFHARLANMAATPGSRFHVVDTRRTLIPADPIQWADEMHPSGTGAELLARQWRLALAKLFPGKGF